MSEVASGVSTAANHRVVLAAVVPDVDVVLLHEVLKALVEILSIGDKIILGLGVIRHVNIIG